MAADIIARGMASSSLNSAKTYVDNKLGAITGDFNYLGSVDTIEDLPETANLGDEYTVGELGPYVWNGTEWVPASAKGAKGDTGDQGEQGPQGAPGRDGAIQYSAGEGISLENNEIGVDFNLVATCNYVDGKVGTLSNLTTINKDNSVVAINEVNSIAKGANQAISYNNYQAMVTAINAMDDEELNPGQNIMIVTLEVPDLWVQSVESTSVTYTYTTDAAIISALETDGYIQVGYYKLSQLETQKVDLTDYVKDTDYASSTKGGVIKTNANIGTTMGGSGLLQSATRTYAQYTSGENGMFIGKGTLENVIAGKGLEPVLYDIGSYQASYNNYVIPAILKTDAEAIYNIAKTNRPIKLKWTFLGSESYLDVLSADKVTGIYSFDICLHNKYHIAYDWEDTTEGYANFQISGEEHIILTQAEYDNLTTYNDNTLYMIIEE